MTEDYGWVRDELNYWENPKCPRRVLEEEFSFLVWAVEGVRVDIEDVKDMTEEKLRERCRFYEYVANK